MSLKTLYTIIFLLNNRSQIAISKERHQEINDPIKFPYTFNSLAHHIEGCFEGEPVNSHHACSFNMLGKTTPPPFPLTLTKNIPHQGYFKGKLVESQSFQIPRVYNKDF